MVAKKKMETGPTPKRSSQRLVKRNSVFDLDKNLS
jgi:hypothetical protein